ncbi:MAG: hypothetical protein P8R42_20085 [Candidatus Binatia bacterium]|nr:hypothetical protein [Candidatus Binatia bacterium]
MPGYVRFDTALSYQRPITDRLLFRAQLNATNLSDSEYYASSANTATV